jgi:hypothetical protein
MDRDVLRAWIAERPEIAERLLRVLARRLRVAPTTICPISFSLTWPAGWPSHCCGWLATWQLWPARRDGRVDTERRLSILDVAEDALRATPAM